MPKDNRMAAKILLLIFYTIFNDCILWIHLWQNECQRTIKDFWSCQSGNEKVTMSLLYILTVLAAFIGKGESYTLPASS